MTLVLHRIDDRLIHGQVVVGWGQPLNIQFIVLVDDGGIPNVNLGGIHHRAGRTQRLRYVFLNNDEEAALRDIATQGVSISAQDVPGARPIPLDDLLAGVAG